MMEIIFLKTEKQLIDVAREIFGLFNFQEFEEGESSFYLNSQYYERVINQSAKLRISLNNYDYEDLFNVYISLKMDKENNEFVDNFCGIISKGLQLPVAREKGLNLNTSLVYYYPNNIT